MTLLRRGPLGLKPDKPRNGDPAIKRARRKAVKSMSDKRRAYLASPEREQGKAHMGRVAQLPCLVCGAWPVEVHHADVPRNDFRVMPLCPRHHRREFGEGAYHYSPRAFFALHGDRETLLAIVADKLAGEFNE